ncbi:MAG: hypothetical protein ACP6IY_16290 [Promethearchaeia archaeon]
MSLGTIFREFAVFYFALNNFVYAIVFLAFLLTVIGLNFYNFFLKFAQTFNHTPKNIIENAFFLNIINYMKGGIGYSLFPSL